MNTPIVPSPPQPADSSEDSYLKFQLTPQTPAILAMADVQEVMVVPNRRLTPMPNMPESVLGLINRRNRVLWVVDLAQMLRLQTLEPQPQQYKVVVARVGYVPLGLAVQEIQGVTRFKPESMQSEKGLVTSFISTYLHGCILQGKEILLVLNAAAILASPLLHDD